MSNVSPTWKETLSSLSEDKARLLEMLLQNKHAPTSWIQPYARTNVGGRSRMPASWAQQRLWFLDQLEGGIPAYHVPFGLRFRGPLDREALRNALNSVVLRHEVLRTVFVSDAGEVWQEIADESAFVLQEFDLSSYDSQERERQLQRHKIEEARTPFDLAVGPLIRGRLLRQSEDEWILLITMHHIVSDLWSRGVLLRDIADFYRSHQRTGDSPKPLSIQYADFAQWQRRRLQGSILDAQIEYWRARLAGASPFVELPTDRPRPSLQSYRGEIVNVSCGAQLSAKLQRLARRHRMTLFMVLYAGWAILLSRLSGQEDVVSGTPIANRQQRDVEQLIGFFVNTLALRVTVQDEILLETFLREIKELILQAYEHQDAPFEKVVEALQPERSLSRNPLFQVMFALQNAPPQELKLPEVSVTIEGGAYEASIVDLCLLLHESDGDIAGTMIYASDLFNRETVQRWVKCYLQLLASMTEAEPQTRIGNLRMLPDAESHRVLELFNRTHITASHGKLIHHLFEEQVRRTPEAEAVLCGDRSLTYAELNQQANQLARLLLKRGVGPDHIVAICADRRPEMIVGLLAILKSGAAYVPLDPAYPTERLQYMLEDAGPLIVLTEEGLKSAIPTTRAEIILLGESLKENSPNCDVNLPADALGPTPQNLAYVIYTSGSTGRPKGTAMIHRALVNLIEWHRREWPGTPGQRVLQFAALSFDVSFQEIFSTLCTGSTLVLLDEGTRRDPRALVELLNRYAIERLFVPPVMLQSLAECIEKTATVPIHLRDVIAAGEQLRISSQIRALFRSLNGGRLHNHYGPTEAHVVTALTLDGNPDEWPTLPSIGYPIDNAQILVLSKSLQPVPVGVTGEIYIGGACLARGYLNRAWMTAQRFLANPFAGERGSRLYRTGDIGRFHADGTVGYLGRNDDQVKIRGFRIELGEIEAELARHPGVEDAAVVACEMHPGEKRLVAYISRRGACCAEPEQLQAHLKRSLPDHMIPSVFISMEKFPLTPSGKLDRRALPAPDPQSEVTAAYRPPEGPIEELLAEIWKELLGVERIGRGESFFAIGGHSLLAVKMVFRIAESFGLTLKVADVYKHPALEELAARIQGAQAVDDFVDLSAESVLDAGIGANVRRQPSGAILLTGATGFVGRFLLAQLLEDTDATLYCLVRGLSVSHAWNRLRATLVTWNLWREEFSERIVAVVGDQSRPQLGIDSSSYRSLCECVDTIYHCGTSMNHLETYAMAKAANVECVRELLKIATQDRLKLINYVSSLGVFGASDAEDDRVVHERTPIDAERHRSSRGYVASKWVGEKLTMLATERGIPCNIFRLGLVWADSKLGRYDELQREYRIMQSALTSGSGISNYSFPTSPTPVDYVARAIVHLAAQYQDGGEIFHISSPHPLQGGLFERLNEIGGTALRLMPLYDWICEMKRLHYSGYALPVVPLIEAAFSMDEVAFREYRRQLRVGRVQYDCSKTWSELERAGITAPPVTDTLLVRCLQSMVTRVDTQLASSATASQDRDSA